MAGDIEPTEEERLAAEADAKAQREQDIAERLKSIEANVSDNTTVAKLMADPDMRALLAAKQAGKKVKLVMGEDEDESSDKDGPPDYDNMSNKDLVRHFGKAMTKAVSEATEKRVVAIENQLAGVMSYIQTSQESGVHKQIETMQAKYSDFDDLRKTMAEINRATPGHSVEELYVLAKIREGGLEGLQGGLRSERPTGSSARPPVRATRKVPLPTGRRGFDVLLAEALDKHTSKFDELDRLGDGEELEE